MNEMNKVYIVCEKVFFNYTISDVHIIKVFTDLDNAKDEIWKQADLCITGDNKWRKTDTNGVNFVELEQGLYTRRYYIIEKFVED